MDKIYAERKKNNLPHIHYEKVFEIIRDDWIKKGKINALIKFICDEFDSGQWDKFHKPLEKHLLSEKKIHQFKKFWKELLQIRINDYLYYKRESDKELKKNNFKLDVNPDYKNIINKFHKNIKEGFKRYNKGLKKLKQIEEINLNNKKLKILLSFEKPEKVIIKDNRKINEVIFWELIVQARKNKASNAKFIENISNKLIEFSAKEIKNFYKIFLGYFEKLNHWDVWAFAFIYRNGCGDDEFDYFKSWVISMGPDMYNKILKLNIDKNDFQNLDDPQLEGFLYLPENIYESITYEEMPNLKIKKQQFPGKEWDEINLQILYPKLCKEFSKQI